MVVSFFPASPRAQHIHKPQLPCTTPRHALHHNHTPHPPHTHPAQAKYTQEFDSYQDYNAAALASYRSLMRTRVGGDLGRLNARCVREGVCAYQRALRVTHVWDCVCVCVLKSTRKTLRVGQCMRCMCVCVCVCVCVLRRLGRAVMSCGPRRARRTSPQQCPAARCSPTRPCPVPPCRWETQFSSWEEVAPPKLHAGAVMGPDESARWVSGRCGWGRGRVCAGVGGAPAVGI